MGYEIRVVSNEEFDSLPYKRAKNSLGLADAKNRIAYVRETGIRDLDENTINHEFDELLMKVSPHEEDGIRYKGGGNILGTLVTMVASAINPVLGMAVASGFAAHKTTGGSLGGGDERQYKGQFWRIPVDAAKAFVGAGGLGKFGQAWDIGGKAAMLTSAGLGAAEEIPTSIKQRSIVPSTMGGLSGYGQAAGTSGISSFGSKFFGEGAKAAAAEGAKAGITGAADTALSSADLAAQSATGAAASGTGGISGSVLPLSSKGLGAAASGTGLVGAGSTLPLTAAAPAGQSLLSKFGDFTKDYAKKSAPRLATNSAINAITAPDKQEQQTLFPEQRTPAGGTASAGYGNVGALSRFNPSLLNPEGPYSPINQQEYDAGISNLARAKQSRISDIFSTPAFRGQTVEENSQLANQIANLNTGYQKELEQYNIDIGDTNLRREYNAVRDQNNLNDAQMAAFIDLAQMPDEQIKARVLHNSSDEIKAIFGHLLKNTKLGNEYTNPLFTPSGTAYSGFKTTVPF